MPAIGVGMTLQDPPNHPHIFTLFQGIASLFVSRFCTVGCKCPYVTIPCIVNFSLIYVFLFIDSFLQLGHLLGNRDIPTIQVPSHFLHHINCLLVFVHVYIIDLGCHIGTFMLGMGVSQVPMYPWTLCIHFKVFLLSYVTNEVIDYFYTLMCTLVWSPTFLLLFGCWIRI